MPKPNTSFSLSVEDVAVIEEALRMRKKELSLKQLSDSPKAAAPDADEDVRQIHELLGHLHNQKVFYRPSNGAYVSG